MTAQSLFTLSVLLIAVVAAARLRGRCRREFIIRDGFAGLLYEHGNLVGTLVSGRHVRWGRRYEIAVVDLRAVEPAGTVHGVPAPAPCEPGSVPVLFAERLFTVRNAATNIRKQMDPVGRLPPPA
jgi:hypothetical protein